MVSDIIHIFSFITTNIIMFYTLIYDLKYRRIPNSFFKYICLVIFIFNSFDFISYSNSIISYLIIKFLIILLMVVLTFFLFNLNFIGGADAKLTITLFLMIPINIFSFSLIFKYITWFLIFQVSYVSSNFINNYFFKSKSSFDQFFVTNDNNSKLKHIYFNTFYKFSNCTRLTLFDNTKFLIKDSCLYFNFKSEKFEILTIFRPPLIMEIIIIYYFLFII